MTGEPVIQLAHDIDAQEGRDLSLRLQGSDLILECGKVLEEHFVLGLVQEDEGVVLPMDNYGMDGG